MAPLALIALGGGSVGGQAGAVLQHQGSGPGWWNVASTGPSDLKGMT